MGDNYMLLHVSSIENLSEVSPEFFGLHSYTLKDREHSDLPRTFFYLIPDNNTLLIESGILSSYFYYRSKVQKTSLYDLRIDRLKLLKSLFTIDSLLRDIKNRGYSGVIYDTDGYTMVNLFYPTKCTPIDNKRIQKIDRGKIRIL